MDLLSSSTTRLAAVLLFLAAVARVSYAASTSTPVNCDSVKYTFTDKPLNEEYHKEAFNGDVFGEEPNDAGEAKASADLWKEGLLDQASKAGSPATPVPTERQVPGKDSSPSNDSETERETDKVLKSKAYAQMWATADLLFGMDYAYIVFSMRDLALYVCFIVLLHFLTFGVPNPTYNYYSLVVRDLLTKSQFYSSIGDDQKLTTFESVRAIPEIWDYINEVFVKFIYEALDLVTDSSLQTVLIDNVLIGAPALEMKRVRNGTCQTVPMFEDVYKTCYDYYRDEIEDTDTFGKGHPWEYVGAQKEVAPLSGQAAAYGGGGFHMNFSADRNFTTLWLNDLREKAWIRAGVRFVSLDFILYARSPNLFLYPRLIFEVLPTGGVLPSVSIYTLKLFRYFSKWDFFSLSCEFGFIGFVLYYTFEEVQQNIILGRKYYMNIWNGLDLIVVVSSYIVIGTGIMRFIVSMRVLPILMAVTTMQHEDLGLIAYWQHQFDTACALAYFFALSKLCKFFALSRFVDLTLRSFRNVGLEIVVMLFLTIFVTCGFAVMGMVLFGEYLVVFSQFRHAFYAIFGVNVGVLKYYSLARRSHTYLAPAFFAVYVILVTLCFMTFFIALVVHGYSMTLKHGEGLKKILLEDMLRAYFIQIANFFKSDHLVRKYTARHIVSIHKADYDEFVAVFRRHHIDPLQLKLMMQGFEINRGDALALDELTTVYNDFWLREQLFFEVHAHDQIQHDLQEIERTTISAEQTLRDIQLKLDILADMTLSR